MEGSEGENERSERESERSKMGSYMLQLQQERNSKLEEENLDMRRYVGRLEGTLMESEAKCVQAEQQITQLIGTLREKDREVYTTTHKLQEVFEASGRMDETIQLLQKSMQRLEIPYCDTSRLEEVSNEEAGCIAKLEKEIDEEASIKGDLEERLDQEAPAQIELSETEAALQVKWKKFSDAQGLPLDLQAQLEQVRREMLQQQLKDLQKRSELKDQMLKDMQDFLSGTKWFQRFSKEKVLLVEEKSTDVVAPELAELTDMGQDSALRQLKFVNMQLLEEKLICRKDPALKSQMDLDRHQRMHLESKEKLIQSESSNFRLKCALKEADEVTTSPQNTKEVASASMDTAETTKSLNQWESENARLEESLRQQADRIKELEEVDETLRVKRAFEEQLTQDIPRQSLLSNAIVGVSDTEVTWQDEQQKSAKAPEQHENLQAQLDSVKIDRILLWQQLREAQKISELRDLAVMDMQRCMNDTLEGMQAHCQERIDLTERRNKVLASDIAQLQVYMEHMKADRDNALSQIQKELAETRKKLSFCEERLEDKTLRCRDIKESLEKTQECMTTTQEVLQQTNDKYVPLEGNNFNLTSAMEDKEHEVVAFSQKLMELASTSKDTDKPAQGMSQQLLVSENLRLEEALKQQAGRISELEKEVYEAIRVKRDLEERLGQDMERQSLHFVNAQLQEQLERLDPVKTDDSSVVRKIQKELAEMQQELSLCKESLEDKTLQCRDLQEEKLLITADLNTLKELLQQTDNNYVQLERDNFTLKCAQGDKEREDTGFAEVQGNKKADTENLLRDVQKEMADMREKLSSCEDSLDVQTRSCRELEGENVSIKKDMNTLRGLLQEAEERYLQFERGNFSLNCALDDKEREVIALTQKLQEVASASTDLEKAITPVDVQRLGSEETDRDMKTQLSLYEELLEEATRRCTDFKEEKLGLQKDLNVLRRMLQESEEKQVQLRHRIFELEGALDTRGSAVISQGLEDSLEAEEASVMKESFEDQSLIEALQVQTEREVMPLYRRLEAVEEGEVVGEQVWRGVPYPFSSTLANTSADYNRRAQVLEELGNQDSDIQQPLDREIPESRLSLLPRVLAKALELLEIKIKTCRNLEEQADTLRKVLEATEHQSVCLEQCVQNLKSALDSKQQEVISTSLRLHQAVTHLSTAEKTTAQLEESVHRLEAENGELKAESRRQTEAVTDVPREAAGWRGAKMDTTELEDWVNRKVQRHTSLARREVRREVLSTQQEKALAQMKAKMEQLSSELPEDVGSSWSPEEENTSLVKPMSSLPALSDSFKHVRSRRELEEEVRRCTRELDEEVGRSRSLEENTTLGKPFSSWSNSYKVAASHWAGLSHRFN